MDSDSDEERLPQFIDHIPNFASLNSLEDVEKFFDSLEDDTHHPAARLGSGIDCLSVEQSCAKIKELCQNTAQTFEKLKRQNDELKKTASSCKKVMMKSLESRREATEAIKQLNAETQHVLDDDVDDALLESVQKALTLDNDQAKYSVVSASSVRKNGIELQRSGNELKVIYHSEAEPDREFFVILSTATENNHKNADNSTATANQLQSQHKCM
ncbi:uncharacterized protein LOC142339677 [Convolutriloba macropyga]|uniref:uncharacterized protein LOC142339677 n=1 Tax=Convolutriloba macropyga TaxID=536237 RepID=UPI003F523613